MSPRRLGSWSAGRSWRAVRSRLPSGPALQIIAIAFAGLAIYIAVQSAIVLASADRPGRSVTGAIWLTVTAGAMFALAYGKADTGRRPNNRVPQT